VPSIISKVENLNRKIIDFEENPRRTNPIIAENLKRND